MENNLKLIGLFGFLIAVLAIVGSEQGGKLLGLQTAQYSMIDDAPPSTNGPPMNSPSGSPSWDTWTPPTTDSYAQSYAQHPTTTPPSPSTYPSTPAPDTIGSLPTQSMAYPSTTPPTDEPFIVQPQTPSPSDQQQSPYQSTPTTPSSPPSDYQQPTHTSPTSPPTQGPYATAPPNPPSDYPQSMPSGTQGNPQSPIYTPNTPPTGGNMPTGGKLQTTPGGTQWPNPDPYEYGDSLYCFQENEKECGQDQSSNTLYTCTKEASSGDLKWIHQTCTTCMPSSINSFGKEISAQC